MKSGYLKVDKISNIDNDPLGQESCNFHIPRDENNNRIIDKILYKVSYGFRVNSTASFVICEECYNKLSVELDALLLANYIKTW